MIVLVRVRDDARPFDRRLGGFRRAAYGLARSTRGLLNTLAAIAVLAG
jgi:hypothetical protein